MHLGIPAKLVEMMTLVVAVVVADAVVIVELDVFAAVAIFDFAEHTLAIHDPGPRSEGCRVSD